MGSPSSEPDRGNDERLHAVVISQPFYLQTTEVTRKQWKVLMGEDPSPFPYCGDQCPVHRVKWDWVMMFIRKLNAVNAKYQYRLPTEAEWEYAARAGNQNLYGFGDCVNKTQAVVDLRDSSPDCFEGKVFSQPQPVASTQANSWGLYDMHGNVWEMVSDWYSDYPSKEVVDPQGPAIGKYRVLRGGSWKYPAVFSRSANRKQATRDIAGFRLVLQIKE